MKKNILDKKAIIWDMDGVLSDTQKFHAQAESLLLKRFNIAISPDQITLQYAGVPDEDMFKEIFEKNKIATQNLQKIVLEKWDLMKEIAKGKIKPIPHAMELIKELKKHNFKLAIASSSNMSFILEVINSLKVGQYFEAIVSSQEVTNGKPAPDIFLLAANRLRLPVKHCVVIEDGINGLIGARAAGMLSIGLADNKNKKMPADIMVTSLDQVMKLL